MERERELGGDADRTAAAAQGLQQIRVLRRPGVDERAVGQHDLGRHETRGRRAEGALEPPGALAQRDARHAEAGDARARHGEPVLLRRLVELPPRQAAARDRGARGNVDADVVQPRDVDDDHVVARRRAGPPGAPDEHPPPGRPGERERLGHIRRRVDDDDDRGPAVVACAEDGAPIVIAGVARADDVSVDPGAQPIQRRHAGRS